MAWNKQTNRFHLMSVISGYKTLKILLMSVLMVAFVSCAVSYKFNGSSINYAKVKTIQIATFPIRSSYVYAPLGTTFNQKLEDAYIRQTRLTQVKQNGDLQIEGEITGYNQYNQSVSADGFSSEVKLQITVNVRFINNTNHDEDFERSFSAFRTYPSTSMLTDVQDDLIDEMVSEVVDQIFNATVANW